MKPKLKKETMGLSLIKKILKLIHIISTGDPEWIKVFADDNKINFFQAAVGPQSGETTIMVIRRSIGLVVKRTVSIGHQINLQSNQINYIIAFKQIRVANVQVPCKKSR